MSWVRFNFELARVPSFEEPSLLIPQPAEAEEVFLNGVFVGGEGKIANHFVTAGRGAPRVIMFPASALRVGTNELRMKVLLKDRAARVFRDPFRLGEHDRIALEAEQLLDPVISLEAAFLTLFASVLFFYLLMVLRGVVRSDYVLTILFLTAHAMRLFIDGNFLYLHGIAGPGLEHLQAVLFSLTVPLMLFLVTAATGSARRVSFWALLSGGVVFLFLDVGLPPLIALQFLAEPRRIYLVLLGAYLIFMSIRAIFRKRDDSWPILLGVGAYVVGSRVGSYVGLDAGEYSMGIFGLCMVYSLVSHHARLRDRVLTYSSRLLDAHETERKRIARDIHDSVGQSLLAHTLNLQMLASAARAGNPASFETLEALASESEALVDDVRRTTMDLRPSFVEAMSLGDALKWYAGVFEKRGGCEVRFHSGMENSMDCPDRIKDNLYRAFQEILANSFRHSEATRIEVSLYRDGNRIVLQVADDGKGFDPLDGRKGLGLETMRERAELLGGECKVESGSGRGTSVTITVPDP